MNRRNGVRNQDLALALARLEAAFGPVRVLEVRPHPRPARQRRDNGGKARDTTVQAALDLDSPPPVVGLQR